MTITREPVLTLKTTAPCNNIKTDFFDNSDLFYGQENSDDDDVASLCSNTTYSTTFTDSSRTIRQRRVSFATNLIADVWTRPRTLREDVAELFYSSQETQQFRDEYRWERERIVDTIVTASVDDDVTTTRTTDGISSSTDFIKNKFSPISRAVIFDKTGKQKIFFPDNQEAKTSGSTIHTSGSTTYEHTKAKTEIFDFDDDSFWNGELTWY